MWYHDFGCLASGFKVNEAQVRDALRARWGMVRWPAPRALAIVLGILAASLVLAPTVTSQKHTAAALAIKIPFINGGRTYGLLMLA